MNIRWMKMIEALIRGRRPSADILVPPGKLICRRSSDLVATVHPDLAEAIRFIHSNADKPILVRHVLQEVHEPAES